MDRIKVAYVVGNASPTSIPLDVARAINDDRVHLEVIAYYEPDIESEDQDLSVNCLGVQKWWDPRGVWRLANAIGEYQPDIVHVHHTISAFWAALLGKVAGTAEVVRTEHNDNRRRSTAQMVVDAVSQGLSSVIICNSENTFRSVDSRRKSLLGGDWKVIHNGIDCDRIERAKGREPPFEIQSKDGFVIGSVGRLISVKNYERLLQAFVEVRTSVSDVHLVLIGEGKRRKYIEQLIRTYDLAGEVTLTGSVSREKVYAALHNFDLFVMPSLSEGFCNAAVEAMAAGLPLVCSDISTLHEVVGDVAVYADCKNSSDIANKITELLRREERELNKVKEKVKRRATQSYSINETSKRYTETYIKLAKS